MSTTDSLDHLERIPRIVRILLAYRQMTAKKLATLSGLSEKNMSVRMAGLVSCTIRDLERLAAALDVDPAVWFDTPENALRHLRVPAPAAPDADTERLAS